MDDMLSVVSIEPLRVVNMTVVDISCPIPASRLWENINEIDKHFKPAQVQLCYWSERIKKGGCGDRQLRDSGVNREFGISRDHYQHHCQAKYCTQKPMFGFPCPSKSIQRLDTDAESYQVLICCELRAPRATIEVAPVPNSRQILFQTDLSSGADTSF